MPHAAAPTVARSRSSVFRPSANPRPSSPSRFSAGTRQFSNAISPSGCGAESTCAPRNGARACRPARRSGDALVPRLGIGGGEHRVEVGDPGVRDEGLGRRGARTRSPSRRAVVAIAATSEPASGSVIAKAPIARPARGVQRPALPHRLRCRRAGSATVPSPWSANTASASGEAAASASRTRQQARQSRSPIGANQPAAPRSASSARASRRAASSSAGSGRGAI